MKRDWIDVSVPVRSGMVHWPGDTPVSVEQVQSLARGDAYNLSRLEMSAHSGTHMDAPLHFRTGARPIDALPFEAVIGPARVIEIRDAESIKPDELRGRRIRRGERVLFKTRGSARRWRAGAFDEGFVYIAKEAAQFLADRGVRTVGVDYLSVGGFKKDSSETHQILLDAGIWIIEGLNLSRIQPGRYDLICLPLRLQGAEGAPARALLRPRV
jgi:arylformamidase